MAVLWRWLLEQQPSRARARRLHLEETISLGQKRFIALVRVDDHHLLVGGGASEVALLANLSSAKPFSALLKDMPVAPTATPAKRTRKRATKSNVEREKCA